MLALPSSSEAGGGSWLTTLMALRPVTGQMLAPCTPTCSLHALLCVCVCPKTSLLLWSVQILESEVSFLVRIAARIDPNTQRTEAATVKLLASTLLNLDGEGACACACACGKRSSAQTPLPVLTHAGVRVYVVGLLFGQHVSWLSTASKTGCPWSLIHPTTPMCMFPWLIFMSSCIHAFLHTTMQAMSQTMRRSLMSLVLTATPS